MCHSSFKNIKGVGEKGEIYINNFQSKQINGKNLTLLDSSDLIGLGVQTLDHRIVLLNLIRNLVQVVSSILIKI